MGLISNIYLLIFIPLIASLFCQIISGKKAPFYLAAATSFSLLFLAAKILPEILVNEKIANDFQLSILSLALEFRVDILSITFLILLLTLKIIILFFFRNDIERSLPVKSIRNFYSVFLLHLFALSGIFTTNNIFNLFLFLEIYIFSFFAISTISRDLKLLKISFSYFCFSVTSSLVIIFCFLLIYLSFGEVNFDKIIPLFYLTSSANYWFVRSIFALLALAFLFKFFPLWLFFKKLKSSNLLAGFMVIDSLFIKTLVGVFLTIKFCYLFFGSGLIFANFHFDVLFIIAGIFLVCYSAFKLYGQKHLKLISAYLCLNNLGFIIIAMALQRLESLQALFFYLLNFCLTNLFIFLFAIFLKRHFKTSSIEKIWLIRKSSFAVSAPLMLLIFFIAAFPLSLLFFANWYLTLSAMEFGFEILVLIALILSNFIHVAIAFKFIKALFFSEKDEPEEEFILKKHSFYLTSFWLLIILTYATVLFAEALNNFSFGFASYLLSNTI